MLLEWDESLYRHKANFEKMKTSRDIFKQFSDLYKNKDKDKDKDKDKL